MARQLSAVIVGAGHRSLVYASFAREHPDRLRIVGVADPNELRRRKVADLYGVPADRCFPTVEDLADRPKFADCAINGTMDQQHVPTSLPLLEAGYDILLEKPFATNEEEMWALVREARARGRKVSICHVLRYAPFYAAIRRQVVEGAIGDVVNVQATEHVSYHHVAVGFVRGKWNREERSRSTMLMAKSCHDLDLIAWMKSGIAPVSVSSFGGIFQFRPDRAPAGHGTRCLVDCPIERDCLYSARKHYIDHPDRWAFYVWDSLEHVENPTIEQKIESLRTGSPYGRCVWACDNDVVDHQSVAIEFRDGATATLNMIGGTSKPSRSIHLIGTRGEIQGHLEDGLFRVRHIDPRPGCEYAERTVDLNMAGDASGVTGAHAGGDLRMVDDFLRVLSGDAPSLSSTGIEDSVSGHLMGFCADRSRVEHRTVPVDFRDFAGAPAR